MTSMHFSRRRPEDNSSVPRGITAANTSRIDSWWLQGDSIGREPMPSRGERGTSILSSSARVLHLPTTVGARRHGVVVMAIGRV